MKREDLAVTREELAVRREDVAAGADLLLIGHGSRDPGAARELDALVERVRARLKKGGPRHVIFLGTDPRRLVGG